MIIIRLWHYKLIPYLPQKQLVAQWRECCCIAKNIADNGTPNHILVNKIMDYPIAHFYDYAEEIYLEMNERGYNADFSKFAKYFECVPYGCNSWDDMFNNWHNDRYLRQCYYNLQEKYDCGGITDDEWQRIENKFGDICNGIYNR